MEDLTKWNELSPKLKLECMKWLDFKTRWNLRSTSKTERSFSDSQKFKIDKVFIDSNRRVLEITQNGVVFKKNYDVINEFLALSEYILHHGILEVLIIDDCNPEMFLKSSRQYSVKNLEFTLPVKKSVEFWIGKMNDKLKSVKFHRSMEPIQFLEILTIPKIMNLHSLIIKGSAEPIAKVIIKGFIKNGGEIGQKFGVMNDYSATFERISRRFRRSIVSKSEKFARIKTEIPEQHILLEASYSKENYVGVNLQMTVIPASFEHNDSKMIEEEEDIEKPENLIVEAYNFEKWDELPKEMKMECVKWLDIRTRMKVRLASKTEKKLIDSKKFNIKYARIRFGSKFIRIDHNGTNSIRKTFESVEQYVKCCKYILEHGIFEKLEIEIDGCLAGLFHKGKCPFSVKNLKFFITNQHHAEDIGIFLSKMDNKLENLEIGPWFVVPSRLHSVFASPKISNISSIKIGTTEDNETANKLAGIWIQKDAKIGNNFQVLVKNSGSFEGFSQNFKNRLVSESDNFIRIKTDNPSKHILLQVAQSDARYLNGIDEILRMTVIPAELKKYDNGKEWMRDWKIAFEEEPWNFQSWNRDL